MSAAIKNNPNIIGITINVSEFILSQYADDSSFILDDDEKSLNEFLFVIVKIL